MFRGIVATAAFFLSISGTAIGQAEWIPKAMQGVWADSGGTCADLKAAGPASLRKDVQLWVEVTSQKVIGTTSGKFLRAEGPRSIKVLDSKNPTVIIDFTLSRNGLLEETIGARGSGVYLRCSR